MKIDSIRLYQPVNFDRKQVTHFSTRETAKKPVKITILKDIPAVQIDSETDSAVIFFTNISSMKLDSKVVQDAVEEKKESEKKQTKVSKSKTDTVKRPK